MYYGYNNREKILMADKEFIELLGYETINDIEKSSVTDSIRFENSNIYIALKDKSIKANYKQILFHTKTDDIKIVKISNVIVTKNSVSKIQLNYHPIYLDVNEISKEIGLSIDDYKLYLDSFVDQSIIDEKKLLEGDDKAIKNLSNLALTLKIPKINILLLKIKKLSRAERVYYIDEYYTKLALLTLKDPSKDADNMNMGSTTTTQLSSSNISKNSDIFEQDISIPNKKEDKLDSRFTELINKIDTKESRVESVTPPLPKQEDKDLIDLDMDFSLDLDDDLLPLKDEPKPIKKPAPKSVATQTASSINKDEIVLENAPKLPINYNPKIAADELNLPVVLIEEFVEDFIEQAHHDKDHLLASYYQKDMDNIHELGHKLKGAASNLRINELADVLEDIQFCTEHSKLKSLFIRYWGLFKSLEDYMKQPKQL